MTKFDLPTGNQIGLIGPDASLSYDDIIAIKARLQGVMSARFDVLPKRILGCLDDSLGSLMALLACPEVCDYMPINPRLRIGEICALAQSGGVDAAILTDANIATLGPALIDLGITVTSWDTIFAEAMQTSDAPVPIHATPTGRLILHTSGTTGTPKRVPISIPAMMQSSQNIARHHELQSDDLALNTLPTFHIGAVVDVLLAPFHAGGTVALTSDRAPRALAATIRDVRPTWVQLVPTILMHMIEELDGETLKDMGSSLRFVRNISAPVPPHLRERAEELLGCPIIEMYGMTETAGQITTNGRSQSDRRPGTVGRETAVPIKILDSTGSEVAQGRSGEICVSGPTVFQGYEGVARETVFFGDWFRTGDLGASDADGFLAIRGRLKEMINIGGEKVAPSEIETVALAHPDIKEAAAYALAHDTLGESSGLTVAVRRPIDPSDLHQYLSRSLADFKLPRRIQQVDALPRLPNAKVDRLKIARDAATAAEHTRDTTLENRYTPNSIEQKVADLWCKHLKSRAPEGSDDFFDMGGDSLSATEFLIDLSDTLGRTVSPNQLFATPTFEGIVAAVALDTKPDAQPKPRALDFVSRQMSGWPGQVVLEDGLFRGIGTIKNGQPLFWSCQNIREVDLARNSFAARRPLYVVRSLYQLRGKSLLRFGKRNEADFEVLTDALVAEITTIQPHGPINIGGFCGGGMVMQDVARALIKAGRTVKLFVSLDFWPTQPIDAPVIHGMSTCTQHSARTTLRDMAASEPVLHPKGSEILNIDAPHIFTVDQFKSVSNRISLLLDQETVTLPRTDRHPGDWDFEQRAAPPLVKITSNTLPRFFQPGTNTPVTLTIKNTSGRRLDPFDKSGLCFDILLINLDGCMRDGFAGFGPLTHSLEPGKTATVECTMRYPNKKIPLLLKACFKSHGIKTPQKQKITTLHKIILPKGR